MARDEANMGTRLYAALLARPGLAMLATGAVSATGFAPLRLWPLALLACAALLAAIARAPTMRAAAWLGYAFGYGQFVIGLNWIARAFTFQDAMPPWLGYGAVLLLPIYLAIYPALAAALAWRLGRARPLALVLLFAGLWAIAEYLRASLFTGFAWNPLGVLWVGTGVDGAARIIGTYGLSLLVILVAGMVWLAFARAWRAAGVLTAAVAGITAAGALYGLMLGVVPQGKPVTVQIVQPNINQNEKQDSAREWRNFARLAALTGRSEAARLVFWPEAAVPAILDMEPDWRARIASVIGPDDLLLLGGDKYHFGPDPAGPEGVQKLLGANNSLWVLDARATLRGRYDKAHLVPYGEYLPMRTLLSAIGLSRLVPGDVDFWPGPGPRTLPLPGDGARAPIGMAVQICYEIIFSGEVLDRANRPAFLFNPSNDAWFGHWGPPQHLAQARLRALEEGVPVIRSTPTGISALIDANGAVVEAVGLDKAGAITAVMPPSRAATLFSRLGNVVPLCLAAGFVVLGIASTRGRR